MENVSFLKDRENGGYIANFNNLKPQFPPKVVRDINAKENPKAEVHKTIKEMVADLRYQNGMLQANVETAKEMRGVLMEYIKKIKITDEQIDHLESLSDEEIDKMTLKDIDNALPGVSWMPWDAPEVEGFQSEDYGYAEYDVQGFMKTLKEKTKDYRAIVDTIEKASEYTGKMAETLKAARIKQAAVVINDPNRTEDEKKKARNYIRDVDIVSDGSAFFRYVIKNLDRIKTCNEDGMRKTLVKFIAKEPDYIGLPTLMMEYEEKTGNRGEAIRHEFIVIAWISYLRYADKTLQRDINIRKSTLSRLLAFFSEGLSATEAAPIAKNIDTMYNVINGTEENPWI
jgi:hypothetical protein